jgi:hypothetical protein
MPLDSDSAALMHQSHSRWGFPCPARHLQIYYKYKGQGVPFLPDFRAMRYRDPTTGMSIGARGNRTSRRVKRRSSQKQGSPPVCWHVGICKVSIPEPSANVQRVSHDGSDGCEGGTETTEDGKSSGIIFDGPGDYGSNANYVWRLVTKEPDVTKIALTIDFVNMEDGWDFLIIESCKQENCTELTRTPATGSVYT